MSVGLAIVLSVAIIGLVAIILMLKPDEEAWRTSVRIAVTFAATAFLFFGGAGLIFVFLFFGEGGSGEITVLPVRFTEAKDLFTTISPIATGVITYWFASRIAEKHFEPNDKKKGRNNKKGENSSSNSPTVVETTPTHEEQNTPA